MARRRRGKHGARWLVAVVVVAAGAVLAWQQRDRLAGLMAGSRATVLRIAADKVDAANEGRSVRLAGRLSASGPAVDAELGVSASAALLVRTVEMYQWYERCSGADCSYDRAWSPKPVDAHAFRHPEGHDNPPSRLKPGTFAAAGVRLGAFGVAPELLAAQAPLVEMPVHAGDLPPNLAASFSESDGKLYAGGDPAHPEVGAVRVSYRVVPVGPVELTGVQRGDAIAAH